MRIMQESTNQFVVAASQATAEKLTKILSGAGIVPEKVVFDGAAAIEETKEGDVLLTAVLLADMSGVELAKAVGDDVSVLMIVPQDFAQEVPKNVLTLHNPISQDALVQAVRAALHAQGRMSALRAQVSKLTRTLEERKVIDRAKGRLMDALQMSEKDAHHLIQKKSMDSGRRLADVAKEILEAETLEGL